MLGAANASVNEDVAHKHINKHCGNSGEPDTVQHENGIYAAMNLDMRFERIIMNINIISKIWIRSDVLRGNAVKIYVLIAE